MQGVDRHGTRCRRGEKSGYNSPAPGTLTMEDSGRYRRHGNYKNTAGTVNDDFVHDVLL